MSEFWRSPEITDEINTLREMPQGIVLNDSEESRRKVCEDPERYAIKGTANEKVVQETNEEKREAARLLRMEAYLCNASFMRETSELLRENPEISADELVEALSNKVRIVHPEMAKQYVNQIQENCAVVNEVFKEINENGGTVLVGVPKDSAHIMGAVFVSQESKTVSLQPQDFKGIISREYPLALKVTATKSLYDFLYNNPSVSSMSAGFYGSAGYHIDIASERTINFPIIVVREDTGHYATLHETDHAENRILQQALRSQKNMVEIQRKDNTTFAIERDKHLFIWGAYQELNAAKINVLKDSTKWIGDTDMAEAMNWGYYYALSAAKNELIADYETSLNRGELPMQEHLKDLLNNTIYDYFSRHMQMDPNGENYKLIQLQYKETLEENTQAALQVIEKYKDTGWNARLELMGEVLKLVPIHQWKKFFETNLFANEVQTLASCKVYQEYIEDAIQDLQMSFLYSSKELPSQEVTEYYLSEEDNIHIKEIQEKAIEMNTQLENLMSVDNKTTPVLQQLQELNTGLEQLLHLANSYMQQSSVEAYRGAFHATIHKFPYLSQSQIYKQLVAAIKAHNKKTFYGVISAFEKEHRFEMGR